MEKVNRKAILVIKTRSYYRKESAAFLQHELNAKVYTSRQFCKGKFTFDPFPRFIIDSMAGLRMKQASNFPEINRRQWR
jgi:hypothetical protein